MAGFSKLYCIGEPGGFQGADGVNQIHLQILLGDGNRQWFEAHYFDRSIKPLGRVRVIVPEGPYNIGSLLDACIAFYPQHFRGCPSMSAVAKELDEVERLDFDAEPEKIPSAWNTLRSEAMIQFHKLHIWEAELKEYALHD